MAKLSDFYTEEEKQKELGILWIDDPFFRAFDTGITELEVNPKEFRLLYVCAQMNSWLTISDKGVHVFGVKLIKSWLA